VGFSGYVACQPHVRTGGVTSNRQHVTPHAHRPGLLHAAKEAACYRRPEPACTVVAYEADLSFSGISRHCRSSYWLHGFTGGCIVMLSCFCTVLHESKGLYVKA
jgi:hypothetical protein